MFGSLPSLIHCWSRWGSMPSKPRITSFCVYLDAGRRAGPEQANADSAASAIAAARVVPDLLMKMNGIITSTDAVTRARHPPRAAKAAACARLHAVCRAVARPRDRCDDGRVLRAANRLLATAGRAHGRSAAGDSS